MTGFPTSRPGPAQGGSDMASHTHGSPSSECTYEATFGEPCPYEGQRYWPPDACVTCGTREPGEHRPKCPRSPRGRIPAALCNHRLVETFHPMGTIWQRDDAPAELTVRCRRCGARAAISVEEALEAAQWHGGWGTRPRAGRGRSREER